MCPDVDVGQQLSTFQLRRRTPGSFVLVPCPRIGRSIRCQGQLEAAAATILAACPAVVSIQEQPCSIWYTWRETSRGPRIRLLPERPATPRQRRGHGRCSYIVPDFLVEMGNGRRRLVEIKPSRKLDRPLVRRKLQVAHACAAQNGWSFHVVSERALFDGPLLANVRLLGRYRRVDVSGELLDRVIGLVNSAPTTLADLSSQLRPWAAGQLIRTALFHLLTHERLACDLCAAPLGDQTKIYPGGTHPWDPFDSVWAPNDCSTDAPSKSSGNWQQIGSSPAS
jgi:hypothetical protein